MSGQKHAHRLNTLSIHYTQACAHTDMHAVVSVLVVACGPVVFELPLRLQSVQIHYERSSSLPA